MGCNTGITNNKNGSDLESLQLKTSFVDLYENNLDLSVYKGKRIVYPIFSDQQANPVIFPKKYFNEILLSKGDRGCKKILKQYPDDAVGISIDSDEVILDCDTKDDYFRIVSKN